ncbi:hypothetical protein B0H15DRAFT_953913 [Mycena belliarum]|uniref:Uncharacterized protein n=1 Tax=Mycena belliarum TaxID=1033014 RepID=A0AAD6TWJ8_9AGAR|nr:hypothetical protein B0H15DRAFT_953913 [Mycena belliae]
MRGRLGGTAWTCAAWNSGAARVSSPRSNELLVRVPVHHACSYMDVPVWLVCACDQRFAERVPRAHLEEQQHACPSASFVDVPGEPLQDRVDFRHKGNICEAWHADEPMQTAELNGVVLGHTHVARARESVLVALAARLHKSDVATGPLMAQSSALVCIPR